MHYDAFLGRLLWDRVQAEIGTQKGGRLLEVLVGYLFDAAYTIRKLYHADGTVIVVIDRRRLDDLVGLRTGLVDALRDGYEAIRFDQPT